MMINVLLDEDHNMKDENSLKPIYTLVDENYCKIAFKKNNDFVRPRILCIYYDLRIEIRDLIDINIVRSDDAEVYEIKLKGVNDCYTYRLHTEKELVLKLHTASASEIVEINIETLDSI